MKKVADIYRVGKKVKVEKGESCPHVKAYTRGKPAILILHVTNTIRLVFDIRPREKKCH